MTALSYKIYPAATPTSGLLVTLTGSDYEKGTSFRQELNGTGSGRIIIHGDHASVTTANFARGNYVLVHDTDLVEDVGGFWLTEGDFAAVSREEAGGRVLTFGGPGSLAYLSKAVMDVDPYVGQGGVYNGPRDDMQWHWGVANTIGSVLKRILDEALHASRPTDPVPDLTYSFDDDNDSAVDPWDNFTGEFTLAVGTNYLSCIETFMKLGLTILMKPDLELDAYQEAFGTDRSSATFAANKVRFLAGTNIVSGETGDLVRSIHDSVRLERLLVAGEGAIPSTVISVTDAGAANDREGFMTYANGAADGVANLTIAGERELALRALEQDTIIFTHIPGDDESVGLYTPGWPGGNGHYWLGDTVRVHTGTGAFDFNEDDFMVAAISWVLRDGGDWDIVLELGATYYSIAQPNVSVGAGGGGCTCPHPPSGPYESGTPATVDVEWHFGSATNHVPGDGSYGDNEDDSSTYSWFGRWSTSEHSDVGTTGGTMTVQATGGYTRIPVTAATTYAISCRLGQRGTTHASVALVAKWYTATTGGLLISEDTVGTSTATNFGWQNVANSLVAPGGAVGLTLAVPYIQAQIDDLVVTHGAGADIFAGDDPPPAASDSTGSVGTDVGCYALCDHQHPAQTAGVTQITDEGGYFAGATVEEVLQELGEALGSSAGVTPNFAGEILISDTPAGTPLVFADLLQNEAQTDLIYEG